MFIPDLFHRIDRQKHKSCHSEQSDVEFVSQSTVAASAPASSIVHLSRLLQLSFDVVYTIWNQPQIIQRRRLPPPRCTPNCWQCRRRWSDNKTDSDRGERDLMCSPDRVIRTQLDDVRGWSVRSVVDAIYIARSADINIKRNSFVCTVVDVGRSRERRGVELPRPYGRVIPDTVNDIYTTTQSACSTRCVTTAHGIRHSQLSW